LLHCVIGERWIRTSAELAASKYARNAEIMAWLRERQPAPWARGAVLDDLAEEFEPGSPRLVLCEPREGLTELQLAQLDLVLEASR
jgi:hypothetical protein